MANEPSEFSEKQVVDEIIQPLDWETLNSFVDSSVEVGHFNRHSESKLKIYAIITTYFMNNEFQHRICNFYLLTGLSKFILKSHSFSLLTKTYSLSYFDSQKTFVVCMYYGFLDDF